ncbi:uncharacterized protein [Oryza sativa Japonica Group]|uniref:uncharacterized protein n=1 Tax=Oryza sativa subsp. japonica TaxID=39947 RepID=UPI00339C608D
MAPPIVGNGRAFPGHQPWPPAVFPVAVPPSPVPGSLPHPIKWNHLGTFSSFSPLPRSLVAAPPLPAVVLSLPCRRPPPAASPSSPERRPVAPSPPAASQLLPLHRRRLRFTRRPPETRPRRQPVALVPLYTLQPAAVPRRSVGRRRRLLRRRRGIVSFPSHTLVSPEHRRVTTNPSTRLAGVLRPPVPPRLFTGQPRHHHLRHRSGKVALGLASPSTEPLRGPSSLSPFVLVVDVPSVARLVVSRRHLRHRHRSGVFHVVPVSVQPLPAALVASSPAPVVVVVVLSSFPVVVAFVPPSRHSRPPPAFCQVCSSPVVVFVLGSASSSLVPAASRLRPRIAAEVVPSPFASIVPELSPPRPFVVVVPTPRRVVACSFACVLRVASVVPEVPEAWFAVVAEGSEGRSL